LNIVDPLFVFCYADTGYNFCIGGTRMDAHHFEKVVSGYVLVAARISLHFPAGK
jgi:hypothetical protein